MQGKTFTPYHYCISKWPLLVVLLILCLCFTPDAQAQTPGFIFQKALSPGPTVLDPNGDGYISKFKTGFVGTNDMGTHSEITYRFLPQMPSPAGPEPLADLVTGSSGGHTDLANVPLGMYYSNGNLMFRVRLGGNSTASKGYSFLLDTDGVFNKQKLADGTLVDYTTPSKVTNLGFEYEVVLALNFDVIVYRHKGSGDTGDPMSSNVIWRGSAHGGYNKFFQKSLAATTAGGDADYFFDFYVPLSAFSADGSIGISPTTPMRISGSTVTSAQTGLEGTISDIGGVDDKKYGNDKLKIWNELIPDFPPTSPQDLENGDFCQTAAPEAPVISTSGGVRTTTTTITGTSTENGGILRIYRNGVEIIATNPVTVSNGVWSFPLPAGTSLALNDKITAKVTRAAASPCPELSSVSSATVTVGTIQYGTCTTTAPIITSVSGKDVLNGTTIYPGAEIRIYKDGIYFASVTSGTTPTTTGGSTYSWTYNNTLYSRDFGYPRDAGSESTSKDYATVNATVTPVNGCQSKRSNSYYMNSTSADHSTPNTTTVPQTTLSPSLSTTNLCSGATIISGTAEPGALIFMYVNGVPINANADGGLGTISETTVNGRTPITYTAQVTTAAGTPLNADASNTASWTVNISSFNLQAGDKISFRAAVPNNSVGNGNKPNYPSNYEGLSAATTELEIGACAAAAPVITTTSPCPTTASISGTSTENGSFVTVYRRVGTTANTTTDTRLTNAVEVVNGAWTANILTGFAPSAGSILYAVATAPNKTASAISNLATVSTPGTAASYGLVLNPIKEGATAITGTSTINGTGTVYLYIDGTKIAGTATVSSNGTSAATWSVSISSANQLNLSPGIQVTASILPSAPAGICESQQTAAQTVTCYAPSSSPVITTTSQTICRGNVATVTITGVEDGVIYQLYNGETATGPSAVGDLTASTSLTLTSGPLAATTTLKVRAFRVGSASCTVTLNGSSVITVNPGPTAFNVTPTSSNVCNGSTAMVSLSGSESGTSYRVQVYDANTDTYVNSGEAVTGTGSAIHLTTAALSTSGTFKVVATSGSCTVDMGNTFTVFVPANNLTLTPATRSICNGATASVTIKSSQAGVTYQLFNGTTASGSAVAGTGGDLTLTTGALTTVGTTTFKVVGTTSSPACSVELTQTFAVTVTPALTTPNITLTSTNPLCDGGTATIRVNSSQLGVTYQIYNGNYTSGSAVVGTGGDIVLTSANLTASTTLTVRASNTCGNTLTSNGVAVTVTAIQAYTVSPTSASICSGSTFTVTLANSTASTTYTLKYYNPGTRTFVDFSPVVSKTNTSTQSGALTLTAPALSANTTLKVVATSGSCAKDMLNTVDVSVSSTTVTFSTSTQKICAGSAASVTILNSQYGAIYQLQTVTGTTPTYTNTGASVTGTGGDITLTSAAFSTNSTNTLRVLVTPSGCPAFGSSTFTVTVASPTAQTVTRDTPASICSGSTSTLSLAASELGVTYQIYANNVAVGLPVQGTGGKISLTTSPLTSTTTLKVVASQSGCSNVDMTNSYTITVGTPNTVFTVAPASQNICANGTAQVSLSGSQSGVYYQLYNGNTATGAQVAGTGSAITLTSGALTANATLTVVALSANACGNTTMDGFSAVTVSPMPLKPTVTSSASTLCGTGNVTFTVGNLVNGVSYQLYKDGMAQNSPITYTGSNAISFTSAISAATTKFTVVATNGTCTPATSDEVTITSVTLATPVIALDNATVCKGNSALLSVTNPANGVVYKLYKDNVYTNLSVTAANGTATFSVNTAGVYKVVATSSGCESLASNTATLTVTEAPSSYALASAATQNVCRGSKATISIAGSEQGVVYQLVNLSTNVPTGTPVTGNGSMIFLYTDAITVDGTYNLKVTATTSTCGFTTEMGETSVIVAECPILYEVEPPYTKVTYTTNEVIATPVLTGWTYTGPLTYTVIEGTPLTGTSVDPVTGKLYVSTSTMSTLQSGTRTLRILATDQLGATRTTYMTYSINDADADGYERAGGIEVLPVQLISFSATPTVAGVQLKWSTASEKDNDFFQIERSQDGRTFTAVGKVQGNGNSNTVKQYGYLDATTTAKTQYYRLKQVDYDGKFEYSRVISAAAGKTVTPAQPLVFPNPFVKEFTLSLTSETAMNVTVELRDLQNRVVKTQKAVLVKGNNHLPLTTDNLPAGTYLLNVTGNGLRLVQKVIKTN